MVAPRRESGGESEERSSRGHGSDVLVLDRKIREAVYTLFVLDGSTVWALGVYELVG